MRQAWHMLDRRARNSRHVSLFVLVTMVFSLFAPLAATPASAASYILTASVPSFSSSNVGAWQLNNSAALSGNVLRLTPATAGQAGSAFFRNRASLANQRSFSSYFVLSFSNSGNYSGFAPGADGIVFTLQTNSNTAGGVGSGIGYAGISPSVGIEFDTFNNTSFGIPDPDDHHVGLDVGGSVTSVATATVPGALKENTWHVWVDYSGTTHNLQVHMSQGADRSSSALVLNTSYDIASAIGSDVYVGFTAATGSAWENHDVRSFYFNNDYLSGGIDPIVNTYTQAPTSVVLSAAPAAIGNDNLQTTTLTATVRGPDNSVMPNQTISFVTTGGTLSSASATTDANGQASVTFHSATIATATVRASAVGGIYGETTVTVTDATPPSPPTVLAPSAGAYISQSFPVFSGMASTDTATVRVAEGAIQLCNATPAPDRSWTCTATTQLAQGPHTVDVTARDAAANTSSATQHSFTVDTLVPSPPAITAPAAGLRTNITTPVFTGNAEPGSIVKVKNGLALLCFALADGAGAWSCTSSPLSNATYTVLATATDAASNVSSTRSRAFTVDTSAPAAPFVSTPANGAAVDSVRPTFEGTAEGDSVIEVRNTADNALLCSVTADPDGDWSCPVTADLANQPYAVGVTATDAAGNQSSVSNHTFVVDTVVPDAPVVTTPLNGATLAVAKPTFTGTAENDATVEVREAGSATLVCSATVVNSAWTCQSKPVLADGPHSFLVTAQDAASNVSQSAPVTIMLDTTPPPAPVVQTPGDHALINDATPELRGTAEANSTVVVMDGTTELCRATADANGDWSCTPQSELAAGSYALTIRVTDLVGNATESSLALVVDVAKPSAPQLATPADAAQLNDATPTFTGTAEGGSTVVVMHGATELCRATADANGVLSCTAQSSLVDGPATVKITATDPAGNISTMASVSVTVDTLAPAAPQAEPGLDGSLLDDATPTFTGTAEAGSTVVVMDGTAEVCRATVDVNGDWSCTPTTELAQGAHTFTLEVRDAAGNTSLPLTIQLTIDSVVPNTPQVAGPADGSATNDTTPEFHGSAEPDSLVEVLDGTTVLCSVVVAPDGAWVCAPPNPLAGSMHSLGVRVTDPAGNQSTSATVSLTIDTVAPAVPSTVLPADQAATNAVLPEFKGQAEPGTTLAVTEGSVVLCRATADGDSCTPTLPLAEGSHTLAVTATDRAGNPSQPVGLTLVVDITVPAALTPSGPADGAVTNDATPEFHGTAEPNSTIHVREGTTVLCTATADADGNWSCSPAIPLANGPHSVTIEVTDLAGNASAASHLAVEIDTDAPDAPHVTGPFNGTATDDATPTFTGTAEPGSTVVITDGTSELCRTMVDGTGGWSCTPATPLDSGSHDLVVTVTDAGGSSSAETPLQLTVAGDDLAAPTISPNVRPNHGAPIVEWTHLPGMQITMVIEPDGDPATDDLVVFVTTADASGRWRVNLGTATPVVGAMPNGGIDAGARFGISAIGADRQGRVSPLVRQMAVLLHAWWLPLLYR